VEIEPESLRDKSPRERRAIRLREKRAMELRDRLKKPVTIRYKVEINPSWEWKGDARELGVSHRELEVLALVIEGYDNKQVAEILHIEYQSVKNHMYRFMQKLNVMNGKQAAVMALAMNLIKWTIKGGDLAVEMNSGSFLRGFKDMLDGKTWGQGVTEKGNRAINAQLLSHGIDVDKLEDREEKQKE